MTDFRALCAELIDELAAWVQADESHSPDEAHYRCVARRLVDRARAALPQQPAPPADGEATEQPPLGPAAQAVLDATSGTFGNYQFTARGQMIAAALRAAAAQMYYAGAVEAGDWLVAIAAKLDGGAQ